MIRDYNSRKKDNCPIDGIYLVEFNIYEATISITNQTKIWLGLTKGTTIIKYCFAQKRRSMTLTYHNIWSLQDSKTEFNFKWRTKKEKQ